VINELLQELRSYPAHYMAAHRAADALEKAERNMHAREYHNIYLEDQLLKLEQTAEAMREYIAQQQLDIITLGQEVGRLREALEYLVDEQNGPPLLGHEHSWRIAMEKACAALAEKDEKR
jgi:hypothetical protein